MFDVGVIWDLSTILHRIPQDLDVLLIHWWVHGIARGVVAEDFGIVDTAQEEMLGKHLRVGIESLEAFFLDSTYCLQEENRSSRID